mmetsp:Transcript_2582/g.4762  ORF Transcript_2582/g.4762 Transcript_2582/m.4762 type:complete len:110 (+) Transcript_2582:145-474(+)
MSSLLARARLWDPRRLLANLYTRLSAEDPPVLIISKIRRSYGANPTTSRAISRHMIVLLVATCQEKTGEKEGNSDNKWVSEIICGFHYDSKYKGSTPAPRQRGISRFQR